LAAQLKNSDPINAAVNIIKGETRLMDMLKISLEDQPDFFCFLSVHWGLVHAVGGRPTWSGLLHIASLRLYPGRLEYLPADEQNLSFCNCKSSCETCQLKASVEPVREPDLSGNWQVIEDEFVTVSACNIQKVSEALHPAPYAHFADSCIDLIVITKCSRAQLLSLISWLENGQFVNQATFNLGSFVKYIKVRAFKLSALYSPNYFGYDGENILCQGNISVANLPNVLTILG
jgi:hypothetical protein